MFLCHHVIEDRSPKRVWGDDKERRGRVKGVGAGGEMASAIDKGGLFWCGGCKGGGWRGQMGQMGQMSGCTTLLLALHPTPPRPTPCPRNYQSVGAGVQKGAGALGRAAGGWWQGLHPSSPPSIKRVPSSILPCSLATPPPPTPGAT